jgi:thioredoxin reductase (NADPH)
MAGKFDIIVIGGGIAGLTAARDCARLGLATLCLTGNTLGGHLISIENVENWPAQPEGIPGYDLCPIAQEEAGEAGAQFEMVEADTLAPVDGGWTVTAGGEVYEARVVILATGTQLKKLNVPGEDRLEGRGVSQCASCDAPLLRGKDVVVVGGGDSALQETLALLGPAAKITIITREDALRAQPHFQAQVTASEKVTVRPNATVAEILGDDGLTGVRLADGEEIACAAVFPFVGMMPMSGIAAGKAALDAYGAVEVDDQMRTNAPGLLAAGTVRSGAAFRAAGSAEDGAKAAQAAQAHLQDGTWRTA